MYNFYGFHRLTGWFFCFPWHHLGCWHGLVKLTSLLFGNWSWLSTGSLALPLHKDAWASAQHGDQILRRNVQAAKLAVADLLKSHSIISAVLHGSRQVTKPNTDRADSEKRERNPTLGGMGGKKPEVTSNFLQSPKPTHEKSATTVTEGQHHLAQGIRYHVLASLMSVQTPGIPRRSITRPWRITRKSRHHFTLLSMPLKSVLPHVLYPHWPNKILMQLLWGFYF